MGKVGVYWIYITIMDVQYGVKKGLVQMYQMLWQILLDVQPLGNESFGAGYTGCYKNHGGRHIWKK